MWSMLLMIPEDNLKESLGGLKYCFGRILQDDAFVVLGVFVSQLVGSYDDYSPFMNLFQDTWKPIPIIGVKIAPRALKYQ